MKRWPLRIFLCLILGAITTVAVAWATAMWCAWSFPAGAASGTLVFKEDRVVSIAFVNGAPLQLTFISVYPEGMVSLEEAERQATQEFIEYESLPKWTRQQVSETLADDTVPRWELPFSYGAAAGWPWHAMWAHQTLIQTVAPPAPTFAAQFVHGGIEVPNEIDLQVTTSSPLGKLLPLRILVTGFLANTAVYAAFWLLVLHGAQWLRRDWRRQRGRCPECGYYLRFDFNSGCPECGWNRQESAA